MPTRRLPACVLQDDGTRAFALGKAGLQTSPRGERTFPTLDALAEHHTRDKGSLPCKLVISKQPPRGATSSNAGGNPRDGTGSKPTPTPAEGPRGRGSLAERRASNMVSLDLQGLTHGQGKRVPLRIDPRQHRGTGWLHACAAGRLDVLPLCA